MNSFFGGTELENGFGKSKHFTTYWLNAFSSDTPQSIKRQNKGQKEHDENIYPVVDRSRPIRKTHKTGYIFLSCSFGPLF